MPSMTSNQRCRAVLNGLATDRAPRYIPGVACAVASELLGRPVNAGTGSLSYAAACAWTKGANAFDDFEEQWLEDMADLYRMFDIDVYRVPYMNDARPARQVDEHTFIYGDPDGDCSVWQYLPESGDYGPVKHLFATNESPVERLARLVADQENKPEAVESATRLPSRHRLACEKFAGEFFVVCNGGNVCVGMDEESLLLLAMAPDLVKRKVMLEAERAVNLGRALAASPYPRVLVAGGDLASNSGPFYSPATFREVMMPALKWMMDELRKLDVHYMFRSDGNLWLITDMLFGEAGCQGYGEVDREAAMDVANLRRKYPELVIWTNVPSSVVACADAATVRAEAAKCIAESGGRRYVHGASNAILMGTPRANVEALFSV